MRVGLVIYGSIDTLSGGYLYDRILVEYLRKSGDEVQIISLRDRGYFGNLAQNMPFSGRPDLTRLEIDILVQDELCHPSLILPNRRIRNSAGYPIIAIVHHLLSSEPRIPPWKVPIYRSVENLYLSGVDGFVFNSETTKQAVVGEIGQSHPSVVAYPGADRFGPGIDPDEIALRSQTPGPLRIMFLGNVIARKGLDVLLAALGVLSDQDWELTVVGSLEMDPAFAGRMVQTAESLGMPGRIQFSGPLLDDRLADEMRRHHVMALPSYYEGYGIAYLEAMGFGMPVIGAEAGAAPEIISPGVDGFLVPPGDDRALAAALALLGTDRSRLLEMSLSAREHYRRSPRWEEGAEKIRSFLRNVIQKRGLNGIDSGDPVAGVPLKRNTN